MPKCQNCGSEMLRMFTQKGETAYICPNANATKPKNSWIPEIYCGAKPQKTEVATVEQ